MTARLSKSPLRRLAACMVGQQAKTGTCPDLPRLDGKLAVITGPTSGIGRETARGLLERGAKVLLLGRSEAKLAAERAAFLADGHAADKIGSVICDLADLTSVAAAAAEVEQKRGAAQIDILIENAGIWADRYSETADGFEISFGTNVLGHFALRRALMQGALSAHARIIVVTGDIYVMAEACTPQHRWHGRLGGMAAYNRSKLGNFWIGRELQRRHPNLNVFVVHPGVVDTALGLGEGGGAALTAWAKSKLLISPREGAQTPLLCATQDDLSHGSYYHNVHGEAELNDADPAMNDAAAADLWEQCTDLTDNLFAEAPLLKAVS